MFNTRFAWVVCFLLAACLFSGCHKNRDEEQPARRTFRMGFAASAPRFDDFDLLLQALELWETSADAAIISVEVPWEPLLAGTDPVDYVATNYVGLAEYYRQQGYELWVYIDPANGLNRGADANALVAIGKSIAQPDVQAVYKRFAFVMDSLLNPEHLGLALETNLIRLASPDSIYTGIRTAANEAAAEVKGFDPSVKLSISVQADAAWGMLQGTGVYEGIEQDLADFGFMEEMGISSYPYFVFDSPGEIPLEYYSRLKDDAGLSVFVSEGGWTSQSFQGPNGPITSSPQIQSDYLSRQADMLNKAHATGLFQLTFTDIDVSDLPAGVDPTINYFAYLGMVDVNLAPRISFTTWKSIFARPLDN